MRILGIDPGTLRLGYGVIDRASPSRMTYVECGVITAPARSDRSARLAVIGRALLDRTAETVVIEAAGVGYLVTVTAAAFRALPAVGAEARLFVYTHAVQDGGLQLYGFADQDERRVFETLLSVQGVGPRVAVAI